MGARQTPVLRNITLDVRNGESVAIVGPSGAGQSTLLHILALLTPVDAGEVPVNGRLLAPEDWWNTARRRQIGMVFQDGKLLPNLNVIDNVCVPLLHRGLWPVHQRRLARDALQAVGLDHRLDHRPNELSGGELMRAAIARALVTAPRLILADEPTGTLDSANGAQIVRLLFKLVTPERASCSSPTTRPWRHRPAGRSGSMTESYSMNETARSPGSPAGGEEALVARDDGRLARAWCFAILAMQGIRSSTLQLILTVLTMAVGTTALALTFFVGRGAIEHVWQDVEQMMGQWVIAYCDSGLDPQSLGGRHRPDFTELDLAKVTQRLKKPAGLPDYLSAHPVMLRDRKVVLPVDGITEELSREALFRPVRGAGFFPYAQAGLTWECMVTETAARDFAIDLAAQPLLLVDGQPFHVVGVVPDPPRINQRFQARVVVPYQSARFLWIPAGTVGQILAAWPRPEAMNGIVAGLRAGLDEARGPNTYFLSSSQFSIEKSKSVVANFMALGAAQALFCIIVASIGVLNVMLTSVTRRTHELAIRLAMGASRRQILGSVIFESVLIASFGAFLGITIAVVMAPHLTGVLATRLPEASLLTPVYCRQGFIYPLLVCGVCGLAAGVLPALRAGRVNVLQALRAEA